MGVSTKGVVLTSSKDVLTICGLLEEAINALILERQNDAKGLSRAELREKFRLVAFTMSPLSETASAKFTINGEARDLWVFFGCDCDHIDLAKKSISLSIGCWGESKRIMERALYALSIIGDTYIKEDDSASDDYIKTDFEVPTLMQLIANKQMRPYHLERFINRILNGQMKLPREGTFEEVIGVRIEDFPFTGEHKERWDIIDMMARDMYPANKTSFHASVRPQ